MSNWWRRLKAKVFVCRFFNDLLERKMERLEKENTELCKYYTKNQMPKDDMIDLLSENARLRVALEEIKNKAWDYTSPPTSEKGRVFAGIIHMVANKALTQKGSE